MPKTITPEQELAEDKRAWEQRRLRSATRQELKARQGRSGVSMRSLADTLGALADELEGLLQPDGLALVMKADHFCMHWRGVKDDGTKMINSVMRGSFLRDHILRSEFLALLNNKR